MSSIKIDKIVFPTQKINAKFNVQGIFAFPDEWKTTDQANPGLFTYSVRMSKFQILKGKIVPRQLTQKQKRQQQEKNKKGAKKQSKNPQPNAQQERIKKQQEQKQKARQQLFAKLTPEQQFYFNAEDSFKSPSLKFENNRSQFQFTGKNCLIFEQRILQDKGEWIYVYKTPAVSQQQLAKMRKSKPKTLNNVNDLNPVIMRAWISFEELSKQKDKKQLNTIRCKLIQVDNTPQTPTPNLQNTYIKVNFILAEPIIKPIDQYTALSLINDPAKLPQIAAEVKSVQQLKQQLTLAIQSLAMQYSSMFWKQVNLQQQQRNLNVFLNNKKGQSAKRKQQFLYDFNVTGKYKIFKDRVKKCIVKICQTKYKNVFAGMKSFNGVKCNGQDQIYSQIYNMLVTSYQQTLFKIIQQKKQYLNQVLVVNNQTLKMQTQKLLNSYKQQTVTQRVKRILKQFQIIQEYQKGQSIIKKYIQQYPSITELKYLYGIYCLKYNLKPTKQVLPFIQQYLTKEKYQLTEQKKIQYMLILFNIGGQSIYKGWILLRQIIINELKNKENHNLSRWLALASIVLNSVAKTQLATKYLTFATTEYQKQNKQIKQSYNYKDNPAKNELPTLISIANYGNQESKQTLKSLYLQLINYLSKFSTFQLIKLVMQQKKNKIPEVTQTNNSQKLPTYEQILPQLNQLLVSHNQQGIQKLIHQSQRLYESSSGIEKNNLLEFLTKGYLLKMIKQGQSLSSQTILKLQNVLKKTLMTNSNPNSRFQTLLRLGYVYCLKKQFGNARACLLKYLEKANQFPNSLSGLSYKFLGIACININRIQQGIECFKHWNISNCKVYQPWLYMSLSYSKLNKFILVKQCLTQYLKKSSQQLSQKQKQILMQIKEKLLTESNIQEQYQNTIKLKILQAIPV